MLSYPHPTQDLDTQAVVDFIIKLLTLMDPVWIISVLVTVIVTLIGAWAVSIDKRVRTLEATLLSIEKTLIRIAAKLNVEVD